VQAAALDRPLDRMPVEQGQDELANLPAVAANLLEEVDAALQSILLNRFY
jgi:hypothetical protein